MSHPYRDRTPPGRYNNRDESGIARRIRRQREAEELDIRNLSPFFQEMLPGPSSSSYSFSTPRRPPRIHQNLSMRAQRSQPTAIERERNQYMRHLIRSEHPRRASRRLLVPSPVRANSGRGGSVERRSLILPLYPMDPPSPLESEEETPTQSRHNTPSPERPPVPEPREIKLRPPPNTPESGIPKEWEGLAEDNINAGFGWALSWIDTIKPSRFDVEDRIRLPRIFHDVPRRTLMCLVAHMNVDETVFHIVEVKMKSEVNLRTALSNFFNLPLPYHRLRLQVDKYAEVALHQKIIDRFEDVEYFRLDTTIPNRWILHQIVNCAPRYDPPPREKPEPNFERAKRGRGEF